MKALTKHGFSLTQTGGGCTAYERIFSDGQSILITAENDAIAPTSDTETVLVGLYGKDHSEPLAEILSRNVDCAISDMREVWGVI